MDLLCTILEAHIENSSHFINMLSQNSPLDHRLINSFDVAAYKVPIDHFLELFSNHFTEAIFQVPTVTFKNLMKFCLTNKLFIFGEWFFKQIFGASMGNNLSPTVSYLYMEFL